MTKKRLRIIIGENIRSERIARSISMEELAELLGLTPGFVGLIERGQRGATPITLLKLSDVFGMAIDSFFYQNEGTGLNFSENFVHKSNPKRKKIESLIADFSDEELDFVIAMLKSMRDLIRVEPEDDEALDDGE